MGSANKKRMLVIRFSALGDVAMTLPVVYALARQYPSLHIDYVTTPFFSRLFIDPPKNLEVHPVDIKKDYRGTAGVWRLFVRLRKLKPDAVADLHNVSRTWILDSLFRLTGIKVEMVDKMRSSRKKILQGKGTHPSIISRYADVFARLGFPIQLSDGFSSLTGLPSVTENVKHPAVGIAPFARYLNKTYPEDLMLEVIRILTQNNINVYLFGGRGAEETALQQWAAQNENVYSFAGKYPIETELALMKQMDCMISMDSANHHLASLVALPVVSIWGGTTPACGFMAFGQNESCALHASSACQPCTIAGSDRCRKGNFECMRSLTPRMIADYAIRICNNDKTQYKTKQ